MKYHDLKYLLAYLIPGFGLICALNPAKYFFLTPILAFVLIPFIELLFKPNPENHEEDIEKSRSSKIIFDLLLYVNFPLIFLVLFIGVGNLLSQNLTGLPLFLSILSFGIVLATSGINVAHEIGHRNNLIDQWISRLMLMPSFYMHFNIEHNLGHHKHVATPEDPATALKGQWLYAFWIKSIFGGYAHAWKIENNLIRKQYGMAFDMHNRMIWYHVIMILYLVLLYYTFGWIGFLYSVIIGVLSVTFLETINYVEHYGLLREKMPNGRYEPVRNVHSWNSDHVLGRIMLYELTRHSDHHYKANRKYQILRSLEKSPQLPVGYPAAILLALIPPLWFKIMDKRLRPGLTDVK